MTAPNVSYIETRIKNVSGAERYFGYIPPHGRRLADDESYSFKGDLADWMPRNKRQRDALIRDTDPADPKIQVTRNVRHVVYVDCQNSVEINEGDFVYLDGNNVKPASHFPWDTNLATTQENFTDQFLGIALETHESGDGAVKIPVDISPLSTWDVDCTSEAHVLGDRLALAEHDDGDKLADQTLEVTDVENAIARCVQRDASAATKVLARIASAYWHHNVNAEVGSLGSQGPQGL